MLTVGIVANEPSGDLLGAAVLREIRARVPDARFVGVAGPRMQEEGCESLFPLEQLSVMGLVEVLKHLRGLLRVRRALKGYFLDLRPDVFIGVDAPDFNLGLEKRLRRTGIRTVHLVSPTVWAWRPGRVKVIREAVDLMLSIFPFEAEFFNQHGVPVRYVGHPLADEIPFDSDREAARAALGLDVDGRVVSILPGSRESEVRALAPPFLQTARLCHALHPDLRFAVPLVSPALGSLVKDALARAAPGLPVTLVQGRSREVIAAADCVLTVSGTATLETLLVGRPMVVGYRMHDLTYRAIKAFGLVKVPFIAMANLLVGRELAPELIQERCRPEFLAPALLDFLERPEQVPKILESYAKIHRVLRQNAGREAAAAVLELIGAAS